MALAPGDRLGPYEREALLGLRSAYWHLADGAAYSTSLADLFVSIEKYVWGRDAHDGIAYTVGSTWYFDFSKRSP